jgi:hypothetical protein
MSGKQTDTHAMAWFQAWLMRSGIYGRPVQGQAQDPIEWLPSDMPYFPCQASPCMASAWCRGVWLEAGPSRVGALSSVRSIGGSQGLRVVPLTKSILITYFIQLLEHFSTSRGLHRSIYASAMVKSNMVRWALLGYPRGRVEPIYY